ncbi:F-box protein SKIP19-like [Trifolium pratense]|uniref:F-box protein SKIP19-like n=1 Tax=Trifolium pratense TaxID=57577 RepID=UPI001E691CC5|nr:F-box protein SKIP19-like [Trifolium pratense]
MEPCSIPVKEADCMNSTVPNWLELPVSITTNILQRLNTIDIVTSACKVCPLWENICKDPLMWRTIRMRYNDASPYIFNHVDLVKICRFAVKQSCGHLEDIDIEYFCTDYLLQYIFENGSNLRCMRLANCLRISYIGFKKAWKLSKLEELDISFCNIGDKTFKVLEVHGKSCRLLKSFKFEQMNYMERSSDLEANAIANTMQGLRHLDIQGNMLTIFGLNAILYPCPLLESLTLKDVLMSN